MHIKKRIMRKIDNLANLLECMDRYNYTAKGFAWYLMHRNDRQRATVIRQKDWQTTQNDIIPGYENVGIVLQGPVVHEDSFTINSIRRYRAIYPDIHLVLSTWQGELTSAEREELHALNCTVLENTSFPSENKGRNKKIAHLNNQIFSSFEGVNFLKETGIDYAMKVRSDLRIYRIDFVRYLMDTLTLHGQNRIISVAFSNSMINVPFHMSDFAWFGKTERMHELFSLPYRSEEDLLYVRSQADDVAFFDEHTKKFQIAKEKAFDPTDDFEWCQQLDFNEKFLVLYHEEIYFAYHYYLSRHGAITGDLLKAYRHFLENDIIVVDEYDLLFYWSKSLYSCVQSDFAGKVSARLDHSAWQHIYLKGQDHE